MSLGTVVDAALTDMAFMADMQLAFEAELEAKRLLPEAHEVSSKVVSSESTQTFMGISNNIWLVIIGVVAIVIVGVVFYYGIGGGAGDAPVVVPAPTAYPFGIEGEAVRVAG